MAVLMRDRETAETQDLVELVNSSVEFSRQHRSEYDDIDQEVLENYLLIPMRDIEEQEGPYRIPRISAESTTLKDTETHVAINSLLGKFMLSMVGESGFVQSEPVGLEDVDGSDLVNHLEERAFRVSGNYRAMNNAMLNCLLFGSSVIMPTWWYEEGDVPVRTVHVDLFTGLETVETTRMPGVIKDDIRFTAVDRDDLFEDPGSDCIDDMQFCARRFVIPAWKAREAIRTRNWKKAAVERAIEQAGSAQATPPADSIRTDLDRPSSQKMHDAYTPLVGFEWYGVIPFELSKGQTRRRRLTLLNGELVESVRAPVETSRLIPMYEFVISPIGGRFRGFSPGYLARYTQSMYDAILICLLESVVKMTNLPIVLDRNSGIKANDLARWKRVIVSDRAAGAVEMLQYAPPIQAAFQMLMVMKQQMEGATGAAGPVKGEGFGTKRMTTGEVGAIEQAVQSRPELMASMFEYEYLPAFGKGILELYQQMIQSTETLARMVGRSNAANAKLEAIQAEYDLRFVGSKRALNKGALMQFIERAWSVIGNIPGAAPIFPWNESLMEWFRAAGLAKIEKMVANPNGVEDFIQRAARAQMAGATPGNANGATPMNPSGMSFAQNAGMAGGPFMGPSAGEIPNA